MPLPLVILAGFLGAGKTTLLNRLLADGAGGRRIGVVVNDFGRLNVDRQLLDGTTCPVIELANGCLCCSLQLGLIGAATTLAERGDLDLVVVEASGVSVLGALLDVLGSVDLAGRVAVVQAVAVVDARRYLRSMSALPLIRDQVARAGVVVLNHCDEADESTVVESLGRLRRENPSARVVRAVRGEVDWDQLLEPTPTLGGRAGSPPGHVHWHTCEIRLSGEFDSGALLRALDRLPPNAERVKGFVSDAGRDWVVQKVGTFPATLEPAAAAPAAVARNRLVVLARAPVAARLRELFAGNVEVQIDESAAGS